MGHIGKLIRCTLLSGVSLSLVAQQGGEISSFDFDYTIDSTSWYTSKNLSRIYTLPVAQVGRAYMGYGHTAGNSWRYNQAEQADEFTFFSEAYYRISPKMMLYGAASFDSQKEQKVAGSAFYRPENKPFDLTVMNETNLGNRKLERYHLLGALGYQLSDRWAIGGKFDYTGINMARTKDLRHNNKILQFEASGGVSYQPINALTIGAHYGYNRYIETVSFNMYGTTDQQFMTLINFGAFSGRQELFDTNGYTGKGVDNPFIEHTHQYGFQIAWQLTKRIRLFNEFELNNRQGYYGKKATSSIRYTDHTGSGVTNKTTLSYEGNEHFQQLCVGITSHHSTNNENLWRSETSSSGNTVINYYGQNQVGKREESRLEASYLIAWGKRNNLPLWQVNIGTQAASREITSVTYPYYRRQSLSLYEQQLRISHQINLNNNPLWIELGMAYRSGSGEPYSDGVYAAPSTGAGAPQSQQTLLMREYEYLTANRILPQLGARIQFKVKQLNCFAQLAYQLEQLFDTEATEKNQQQTTIRLGINF